VPGVLVRLSAIGVRRMNPDIYAVNI